MLEDVAGLEKLDGGVHLDSIACERLKEEQPAADTLTGSVRAAASNPLSLVGRAPSQVSPLPPVIGVVWASLLAAEQGAVVRCAGNLAIPGFWFMALCVGPCAVTGLAGIRGRDLVAHRTWMFRSAGSMCGALWLLRIMERAPGPLLRSPDARRRARRAGTASPATAWRRLSKPPVRHRTGGRTTRTSGEGQATACRTFSRSRSIAQSGSSGSDRAAHCARRRIVCLNHQRRPCSSSSSMPAPPPLR